MSFLCQNIRHWNFILLKWTDYVTHLFLDDHLFYKHSVHFDWIFFHIWCSLGHGRKFIKDAPSACRTKWSHKSFWYETGNVLNKCWKETKAIVLMYFLPEVLFKKIKTALRIAFSWIVKKKKKKNAFRIAIFRPATGNRLVFFLALV